MSVLDAPHAASAKVLTASVSSPCSTRKQHPLLRRLERLMDSTGDETDADSESLELALLDVELTKYAAHEGIHIPAASTPSTSAGTSSLAQQLSTTVMSPKKHHTTKPKPMQPGSVISLVQQQSKFLDVLQCMIDRSVGGAADKPHQQGSHHIKHRHSTAVQAAATVASSEATAAATAGEGVSAEGASAEAGGNPQLGMLQLQYERQVADNHALKKRCLKVQKAMLKHMQAARAQAAAAEAACEEARRREQQAAAASTALQAQLNQQQLMLEAQQQQLAGMQEQLAQLKDMHKKKLARYKMQLQQQYESQLAAATTAYTQELSLVHAVQMTAGERFNSSAGGASACSEGHPTPRQVTKKPRPSSSSGAPAVPAAQSVLAAAAAAAAAAPAAHEAPAPTAGSATKKSPPGRAARTSPTNGLGARSSSGGGSSSSSGGGSKHAAAGAAVKAAGGSASAAKAAGGARASDAGSRRQSHAGEGGAAAAAAGRGSSAGQADADLSRHPRPSLPLEGEGEASTQLLHQLSLAGHLPDPHFGSAQAAGQAKQKQQVQRQSVSQGGGGSTHKPETPRRATVNGSGPRPEPLLGESLAARARTTPPAFILDGAAAAAPAGSPGAAAPAAEASGASTAAAACDGAHSAQPVDGSVAVAVAQQLQSHLLLLLAQQLAEHLPPEFADIDPNAILSLQQAMAGQADHSQQQQQAEEGAVDDEEGEQAQDGEGEQQHEEGQQQQQQGQQQGVRQHGASGEATVPEEVLHYAQQYQQGGEGRCRPPTATPSVLQHQHQQQVPEAAAQLAQHFVTGGEGSSRPLTAPSSDRSRAMLLQQQQQGGVCQGQGQRSSSPSGRGSGRQAGMRNEHPAVATAIAAEG